MEQFQGSERLILQIIVDSPKDSAGYVEDTRIAIASKTSLQDVQNWLETLESKGFVERAKQIGGFSAYVTAKGKQVLGLTSTDQVSRVSDSSQTPIRVVPKGLRSFDAEDKDFFLALLPGPRRGDGLPESVHFWKVRIEEMDPDKTFRVGYIFGPSGCGKSSLTLFCGEHVQIGDYDDRFILVLELHPGSHASHPVPKVQSAGRAITGEDPLRPFVTLLSRHFYCCNRSLQSAQDT